MCNQWMGITVNKYTGVKYRKGVENIKCGQREIDRDW